MTWPAGDQAFIPEPTGQIIDPLEMDPAQADFVFGADFIDAVREASARFFQRGAMRYVQLAPVASEPIDLKAIPIVIKDH